MQSHPIENKKHSCSVGQDKDIISKYAFSPGGIPVFEAPII